MLSQALRATAVVFAKRFRDGKENHASCHDAEPSLNEFKSLHRLTNHIIFLISQLKSSWVNDLSSQRVAYPLGHGRNSAGCQHLGDCHRHHVDEQGGMASAVIDRFTNGLSLGGVMVVAKQ